MTTAEEAQSIKKYGTAADEEDSSLSQGHFKVVDAASFPDLHLSDGDFLTKYGNQPLLIRG